jgi:uncharacterized protein (DUF58 family)
MAFGPKITKLDYAKTLGACLTYLVHRQRDRVGLITFDRDVVDHVPASAKHLDVVLHTLDAATATRPGQLTAPLKRLAEHFGRRGVVVLISDLYDEPEAIFDALGPIRFRGSDVVVFHVLDPAELEFPYTDPSAFEDLESGEQLPVVPESFRDKYRALVQGHIDALTAKAAERGVDYRMLDTSKPLDFALYDYLSFRERTSRTR